MPVSNAAELDKLIRSLKILRDSTHERVELTTILALLYVARGEDTSLGVGKRLNLTSGSSSRTISRLRDIATRSGHGYGFIESADDWRDRRNKVLSLTPKGEDIVRRVLEARNS